MFAVKKAKEFGWSNLWLECDSSWVVHLFSSRSVEVPWEVRHQWDSCLDDLTNLNFVVSHIFREGNGVADSLAKYGAHHLEAQWWTSCPDFCTHLLFEDFSLVEHFRFC